MTGQFLSIDPELSKTNEPYEYTGDDPVNMVDPNGDVGQCGRQYPQLAICAQFIIQLYGKKGTSTLYNGNGSYGYLHIVDGGHLNDITVSPGWATLRFSITQVLIKPGSVSYRSSNDTFTYQAPIELINYFSGEVVPYTVYVSVANGNWKIITAYANH